MNRPVVASLLALSFAACTHAQTKADKPVAEVTHPDTHEVKRVIVERVKGCHADFDCGPKQLCIDNQCVDITDGLAECRSVRLHFDYEAADLHDADRVELDRKARCLKADQALHVTIEGNADERGTEEYNLALGDKRANAVAAYLRSLGVDDAQLHTVSFGKERPLCTEHDEDCWAKNRRAELNLASAR